MRNVVSFVAKHWLTLGLLAGSVVLVVWIVRTQRAPGSMTVIEAQAMDMTASKPPPGVQPVAVEAAAERAIGGEREFPASVAALTDEDVVARVAGRVSRVLVYPGDRVRAGSLVATLDAKEIGAQADEARLMALSKSHMALGTEHDIEERKAMLTRSQAALKGARADKARAEAEVAAAEADSRRAQADAASMQADVTEMQAELHYSEQERDREAKLYKAGAVSLDEFQAATKERDASAAKLQSAQAKSRAAASMVRASSLKTQAARASSNQSSSMIAQSQADVAAATTDLAKAYHEQDLARVEARSFAAGASAGAITASYRNLVTQSDGVVSERTVAPGTAVMPGQVVLRIKAVDTVRVQADLPQSLYGMVREGTPVTVLAGSATRSGTVGSVFPVVDENLRTFKVEVRLPNRDGTLAAGMYAKLRVQVGASAKALAVRNAAVLTDAEGSHYVWVLEERAGAGKTTDWTCTMHPEVSEKGPGKCPICGMDLVPRERSGKYIVAKRTVQVGASDQDYTAVLSGIRAGEKVVWAGLDNLQPGMAVQPTAWGLDGPKELPGTGSAEPEGDMKGMPGMSQGTRTGHGSDSARTGPKSPGGPSIPVSPPPTSRTHAATHTIAYICPMKCKGSESDKPGKCPVCGMQLVKAGTLKDGHAN